MDNRRLLLALALSAAVVLLYSFLLAPKAARPPARPAPAVAAAPPAPAPAESAPATTPSIVSLVDGSGGEHLFEHGSLRIVFTARGAVAREIRLRGFYPDTASEREASDDPARWLSILREPVGGPRTFGLRDVTGALGVELDALPWDLRREEGGAGLIARCPLSNGLTFEKVFRPGKGPFEIEAAVRVRNEAKEWIGRDLTMGFVPAGAIVPQADPYYEDPRVAAGIRSGYSVELERITWKRNPDAPVETLPKGDLLWGGAYGKYFAALAKPLAPTTLTLARSVYLREKDAPAGAPATLLALELGVAFHVPKAGGVEEKRLEVYFGPKRASDLKDAEVSYREILGDDYGWFGGISRLLLWILGLFHGMTGSWGVAIILLTLLVRGALFPLNRHQQVSIARFTEKARKLQPELEALKQKYKNDFRKFSEAQGRLYKEHNLRPPVFGCLTILLQFPVWWGLFGALRVAYELRHANFLWIEDLSQPDRTAAFGFALPILGWTHLNVLPIAMTVVWFLQQKMMPKPADPQQAATMKIMAYMPILFGFMLYSYAAGLALYMTFSSLLGIIESKVIRRKIGAAAAHLPPSAGLARA